jgi:hypothetical protein
MVGQRGDGRWVLRAAAVAALVVALAAAVALAQPAAVAPLQNDSVQNDSDGNASAANESAENASAGNASAANASDGDAAHPIRATYLDRAIHETALAGGGEYDGAVTRSDASRVVENRTQLLDALSTAQPGEVVFAPGNATINLTGDEPVWVPGRVTLASDRGVDGSPGALLYTDRGQSDLPLLVAGGERTRISGLRIRGYGNGWTPATRDRPSAWGILVPTRAPSVTIDNNRISHFVGVCVQAAGNFTHVHHNQITNCNRVGLGYGVNVDQRAVVECNYFDHVRHAVAAHGERGNAYVARYNVVGRHVQNHVFDVHPPGGTWVNIYHNTVLAVYKYGVADANVASVRIGVPNRTSRVHHNWFLQDESLAIWQNGTHGPPYTDDRYALLDVHGNAYGPRSPPAHAGAFATEGGHGTFEETCG